MSARPSYTQLERRLDGCEAERDAALADVAALTARLEAAEEALDKTLGCNGECLTYKEMEARLTARLEAAEALLDPEAIARHMIVSLEVSMNAWHLDRYTAAVRAALTPPATETPTASIPLSDMKDGDRFTVSYSYDEESGISHIDVRRTPE